MRTLEDVDVVLADARVARTGPIRVRIGSSNGWSDIEAVEIPPIFVQCVTQ